MPPVDPPLRYILLETGDVAEWPYEDEYALYAQHKNYLFREGKRHEWLEEKRVEFFKLHCIEMPLSFRLPLLAWVVTIYKWFARRVGGAVTRVPFRESYLTFLDTDVIQSVDAWRWIQEAAIIEEVSLSSVLDAARQFRSSVGEKAFVGTETTRSAARGENPVQHDDLGSSSGASGGNDAR
jgi:hypothetical protein